MMCKLVVNQPKFTKIFKWYKKTCGSKANGQVKIVTGKIHDYLAMKLDYFKEGKVIIDMMDYINNMIEEFPYKLESPICKCPWTEKLFNVDTSSQKLDKLKSDTFHHTFVMKCMFFRKMRQTRYIHRNQFLINQI